MIFAWPAGGKLHVAVPKKHDLQSEGNVWLTTCGRVVNHKWEHVWIYNPTRMDGGQLPLMCDCCKRWSVSYAFYLTYEYKYGGNS